MKIRRWKTLGRALAPLQAALLLALSLAIPVLDGVEATHTPVLESKHNPSSCVLGHDHTVCTQFSTNRVLSTESLRHGPPIGRTFASGTRDSQDAPPHVVPLTRRSRAPPLG